MRLSKKKLRVLSGLLCLGLLFQNLSFKSLAEEAEANGEQAYNVAVTSEESYNIEFSDVEIISHGFGVIVSGGTVSYDLRGYFDGSDVYFSCYDSEGNRQSRDLYTWLDEGTQAVKTLPEKQLLIYSDTAYVKFEVYGYENEMIGCSDAITVSGHPNVEFYAKSMTTDTGSVEVLLSFTGDIGLADGYYQYLNTELICGTSEDESTWKVVANESVKFYKQGIYENKEESLLFYGLQPDTEYKGKLHLWMERSNVEEGEDAITWETYVALPDFTTLDGEVNYESYQLKTAFPDEYFRNIIISELKSLDSSLTDVTAGDYVRNDQLGKINVLRDIRRYTTDPAIKDITGIELLSNLLAVYFEYHEISSVEGIDWSKLPLISTLSLCGNEIDAFPDLSGMKTGLKVNFAENLLSPEELEAASKKLPEGVTFKNDEWNNQRCNGLELQVKENYFFDDGKVPFSTILRGYKSGLSESAYALIYLDDVEVHRLEFIEFSEIEPYVEIDLGELDLSYGSHTIKAEYYGDYGEIPTEVTPTYTFNVTDKPEWTYEVDRNTLFVNKEDAKTAVLQVLYHEGTPTYKSSDTNVATIVCDKTDSGKATITAVGVGETTITITTDEGSKSFAVTVAKTAEKLSLNTTAISMLPGDSYDLIAEILPKDSIETISQIVFTSSDEDVVSVAEAEDDKVSLHANASGTATITVSLTDTEVTATCDVNVWDVTSTIEATEDGVPLYINIENEKSTTLQVVNSKGAPVFKSSDTSVITVKTSAADKKQAVVTAVGTGSAYVTVTADGITKKLPIIVDRKFEIEELSFNVSELTIAENTNAQLMISAVPAEVWSDDLAISFDVSGSDISGSDVVSVERSGGGNVVTVTALDRGKATIIASLTLNGKTYSCECEVTVLGAYNQADKNNMAKSTNVAVLLNRFSSSTVILKDVEIAPMDGGTWTWVDDSIKLVADDANPIQYYAAVFEKEGYESFIGQIPVRVSKLTGITIDGEANLLTGTTGAYDITYKYTGYQPTETVAEIFKSYYDVAWSVTDKTSYVTVAEAEAGTGVSLTAAEVTANKSQTLKAVVTVAGSGKTVSATKKLTVIPKAYVDTIYIDEATPGINYIPSSFDPDTGIAEANAAYISSTSNTIRLRVTTLASASGEINTAPLKWTTSDSKVATVGADLEEGVIAITVKKAGYAVIKAVAQDGGKYTKEIVVKVKDFTPIVESKTLNLNLYSTEGVEIPVKVQNGNFITGMELLEKDAVTSEWVPNSKVTVNNVDGKWMVSLTEDSGITGKTTVKPVLRITTQDFEEPLDYTLTVKVVATKPTATVKVKTKANLFYKDTEAEYTISSKTPIASVTAVEGKEGAGFYFAGYDGESGLVTFNTNGTLTEDTLKTFTNSKTKKAANKVELKVTFAGYTEAAAKTITVNVATTTSKPSLKLNDITFVTGVTDGVTDVYDTKARAAYALSESQTITLKSDSSKTNDVLLAKVGESVAVGYDGTKTVTYKAELSDPAWTSKLTLSGKITVVKDVPLSLGMSKVTLNTATSVQKNGTTAIDVAVKNYSRPVTGITVTSDNKSAALVNSGYLYVGFNERTQQVTVGLNEGKRGSIKAGTYKVYLTGTFEWGGKTVTLKKTTLSVALADKTPTVTLSAKGKIDLVQRANTSILYTPKLTNVTANVTGVSLGGAYAKYFEAELVDGKVEISANQYRAMSTKVSYPVEVVLTLDNGMEVSKTVKIKPVSTTPKVTAGLTKGTLYKSAEGSFTFGLKSSVAAAEIEKVVRVEDKNSKYFNFAYDAETEQVTISLSEEASKLKAGKYTISYQVCYEGAAYNVKPVTVKFTVTVK